MKDFKMENRNNVVILCIYWTLVSFICKYVTVSAVMIRHPPANVSTMTGHDAVFTCLVTDEGTGDYVFWKKITANGFADVLTYNNNSMNDTKYDVSGTYTLTIRDVQVEDEAVYECQAGIDRITAMLTVGVAMENMTLSWQNAPPFEPNNLENLTCQVTHSRPPAEITWYHGDVEVTSLTSSCQKTFGRDGFGDTVSTLRVDLGTEIDTQPFICVATLYPMNISRTELVFAIVSGYTSGSPSNLASNSITYVANLFLVMFLRK